MRRFICTFAALVCMICALNNAVALAVSPVISWGIVPNSHERTPEPPKGGAELLKEHNGLFVGDTSQKKAYFTFDLGYEAGFTGEVLDILKENGIRAVFFLCGNYLKEKELVTRILDEGHSIGNHTDRHKDLPSLSDEGIARDIGDFGDKFAAAYGDAPVRFFRPPQGKFDARTLAAAKGAGLATTLWSIAIVDWGKSPIDARASAERIARRIHPGAIILSHITNAGTPKMLRLLIPMLTEKGYQFGDLNDCLS